MKRRKFLKYGSLAGIGAFAPKITKADNSVEHLLVDRIKQFPIGTTVQILKSAENEYIIYGAYQETDGNGCIVIPKKKGA